MPAVLRQQRALDKALQHVDRALFLGLIRQALHQRAHETMAQRSRQQGKAAIQAAGLEAVVTGKTLVRALAGKADRHLLPGLLAEQVQGHGGQVGHGLVQVVERLLHIVGVERVQIEDLMFGPEFPGHNGRIVQFRKGGVPVARCFYQKYSLFLSRRSNCAG